MKVYTVQVRIEAERGSVLVEADIRATSKLQAEQIARVTWDQEPERFHVAGVHMMSFKVLPAKLARDK